MVGSWLIILSRISDYGMPIGQEFLTILDAARILGLSNRLRVFLIQNRLKVDVGDDEKHKSQDCERGLTMRAPDGGYAPRFLGFILGEEQFPVSEPCSQPPTSGNASRSAIDANFRRCNNAQLMSRALQLI